MMKLMTLHFTQTLMASIVARLDTGEEYVEHVFPIHVIGPHVHLICAKSAPLMIHVTGMLSQHQILVLNLCLVFAFGPMPQAGKKRRRKRKERTFTILKKEKWMIIGRG